jgi:hypothetical protein
MYIEKWLAIIRSAVATGFSNKVSAFVITLAIAGGSYLITIEEFRLAEGCVIFVTVWGSIWIGLRPSFATPFDIKKDLCMWVGIIGTFILGGLFLYLTDHFRTQRILSANDGWLLPAAEGTSGLCGNPPEYRVLWLGNTPVRTRFFPQNIITVHGRTLLKINQRANSIAVSATISSADTRVIAVLEDNHWKVNPNNRMAKYNPDVSTLQVDDQYDKRVLDIRYLNECVIRIYLVLRFDGAEVEFTQNGVFVNGELSVSGSGFDMPRGDISAMEVGDRCSGNAFLCLREH